MKFLTALRVVMTGSNLFKGLIAILMIVCSYSDSLGFGFREITAI